MEFIDYIFGQYSEYETIDVVLELTAITASVISVIFSFKNKVLVFPFGIICTIIFIYLLHKWNLLGDMVINGYYLIMSIYGWYIWTRIVDASQVTPVTKTTSLEWMKSAGLFIATAFGIYLLYYVTHRLENVVSYVDMITTGIFFAGMWLMALRKIEHWLVLFVGNVISVPLYFYKGYSFSALLYLFLAIIAVIGYVEWKKYLNNDISLVKK